MNRSLVTIALALGISSLAAGCGASSGAFRSAHVQHLVQRDRGGVVALHGPIVPATSDAQLVMTEHCRGRWRRLEAGEATAMIHADQQAKAESGEPTAAEESWRMDDDRLIAYECMSARR